VSTKALGFAYLTDLELGNHNAGEGGSQLSDLKKYDGRPYISGQAFRHGIKQALEEVVENPDSVDCTPRYACGEIGECKLCDLFGYMNTDGLGGEDQPPAKRLSPLRVSPLVGQYELPQTTDMILQYDEGEDADNRIGYREMTRNTYRGGLMLDIPAIGRRETSEVDGDADYDERFHRQFDDEIDEQSRNARVRELVDAIRQTTQLAGQARHMADFMPDLLVGGVFPEYNQRIQTSIQVDADQQELKVATMESVLRDLVDLDGDIYLAGNHNPNIIENWEEVFATADSLDGVTVTDSVVDCFEKVKQAATNE
jgi:CRISPR-associated protein Cas7/Cst2/DevR subtype I-B